jgi:hypothetical protein
MTILRKTTLLSLSDNVEKCILNKITDIENDKIIKKQIKYVVHWNNILCENP